MYSVLLSFVAALVLAFGGHLLDWWGWGWAILFTVLLMIVIWVLVARRLAARLQPAMASVQKQMEAGHWEAAMQSLEAMLPLGRWVPMLRGQLLAQMGMIAYQSNKRDRAKELLAGASMRAADAQLLLACIHHQDGDTERALQVMKLAAAVNKKHSLLHNTYAWLLHKLQRSDEAQQLLAAFAKRYPGDAPAKENLLRLQNRTRMTMHGFGMMWFALGLEQPPQAMGQMRRAPRGFREPPKSRG